jgi:hypothetical protein
MTREDAHLLNTIREICGQAPIPDIGRPRGERRVEERRDLRFIQNLAQYEGDGNKRAQRKAGAL